MHLAIRIGLIVVSKSITSTVSAFIAIACCVAIGFSFREQVNPKISNEPRNVINLIMAAPDVNVPNGRLFDDLVTCYVKSLRDTLALKHPRMTRKS